MPIEIEASEMETILTDVGLEVEHVESLRDQIPYLDKVVVGEVLELNVHPDADKLRIATVNVGAEENLQIICGAPNVASGIKVAVAMVGAQIKSSQGDRLKIKKAKIRGVESFGMICSEEELGLGTANEGIWILPEDAQVGQPLSDYLDLENADTVYTIGLTPNRTDGMSHIGVANNIVAYLSFHRQAELSTEVPKLKFPTTLRDENKLSVSIEDAQACPRYMGLLLKEIKVGPSPDWIQAKLKSVGVKPINNVVDITNFVLKECGQPLHAFDKDKINGDKVIVRKAKNGETITTLDEKEQKLTTEDLLICDQSGGMCIAGVYGGLNSGVTEATQNVFLESAYFDPTTIRRTSMRLGLRTDAAVRYEKGVDISMLRFALYRTALLLQEYADAVIVGPVLDQYPSVISQQEIEFSIEKVNRIIGKEYQPKDVERLLKGLEFEILDSEKSNMKVAVPFALTDVSTVYDIAEEVLRIDGLNNVPMEEDMRIVPPSMQDFTKTKLLRNIQQYLSADGLTEILTNSIVDSKHFGETGGLVHMINNLSENLDVMRPSMLHSGLEVISYNQNRQQERLRLFEIGKTYHQKKPGKYVEKEFVSIWLTGTKHSPHWSQQTTKEDLFDLRAVATKIFGLFGIQNLKLSEGDSFAYYIENYSLKRGKIEFATLGKVHPKLLKMFDLKSDVWYAEIPMERLLENQKTEVSYKPVSKFPSAQRDLAIVVDKEVLYGDLEKAVNGLSISTLRDVSLFDLYQGDKIPKNKKSLAMSFLFESPDRTLTVEEVDQSVGKIVNCFQEKFDAELRK